MAFCPKETNVLLTTYYRQFAKIDTNINSADYRVSKCNSLLGIIDLLIKIL